MHDIWLTNFSGMMDFENIPKKPYLGWNKDEKMQLIVAICRILQMIEWIWIFNRRGVVFGQYLVQNYIPDKRSGNAETYNKR